jgi:putative membrane protein
MRNLAIPMLALTALGLSACERKEETVITTPAAPVVSTTPAAAPIVVPKTDLEFANQAAESGLAEVEASRAVSEKTADESVRQFAQAMITDHTAANQELARIAQTKNLQLPSSPSPTHQAALDRLRAAMGAESDRIYVQEFGVTSHQEAVDLFERESREGTDAELKAFAAKTLPTLKTHLEHSQRVAGALPK